jgi:hypothetical protein
MRARSFTDYLVPTNHKAMFQTAEAQSTDLRACLAPLIVLGVGVCLEIVFVLLFSPFLTVDASQHIEAASALLEQLRDGSLAEPFLRWNPWPAPSILATLLLAGWIPIAGSAGAETLVLTLYVVSMGAATWYAIRATPGNEWLALFALPLTFSLSFLWGFLSFSFSVVAFLVVAGFTLRTDPNMPPRRILGLAALLVVAFFTHLVGYAAAAIFVAVVFATRAVLMPTLRLAILVRGAVVLVPSALLTLAFVASSGSASATSWGDPLRRLAGMLTLRSGLVTYERVEIVFSLVVAAVLWILVVGALLRRQWAQGHDPDGLGIGLFVILIAFLGIIAPQSVASGGGILWQRLVVFPVFGALLWLSRQRLPRSHVITCAGAAALAALGLAVVRYDDLRHMERITNDLMAIAPCVDVHSTIVQGNLAYVPRGSSPFDPHSGEAGRLAVARDGIDLGNLDWDPPFSLQRFRDETSAYKHLVRPGAGFEDVPPPFDFDNYERTTGTRVDFVLLWGRPDMTAEVATSQAFRRFDRDFEAKYRFVARSPESWWELWKRRGTERVRHDCGVADAERD